MMKRRNSPQFISLNNVPANIEQTASSSVRVDVEVDDDDGHSLRSGSSMRSALRDRRMSDMSMISETDISDEQRDIAINQRVQLKKDFDNVQKRRERNVEAMHTFVADVVLRHELAERKRAFAGTSKTPKNGTATTATLTEEAQPQHAEDFQATMETLPAAVVFADVSGFSVLAEFLHHSGGLGVTGKDAEHAGAEQLHVVLNAYFGKIMELFTEHEGDVIKLAGDACIAVWVADAAGGDGLAEATHAATHAMLRVIEELRDFTTDGFKLGLHAGIGVGQLHNWYVGSNVRKFHNATGSAITQSFDACDAAGRGEVFVSGDAMKLLAQLNRGNKRLVTSAQGEYFRIDEIPGRVPKQYEWMNMKVADTLVDKEQVLNMYTPAPVRNALNDFASSDLAMLRRCTVMFLQVDMPPSEGAAFLAMQQQVVTAMLEAIMEYAGYIKEFGADDKGTVMVAGFGVPPYSHIDDPTRGVSAALLLHGKLQELGCKCCIGVTTGSVYIGTIGNQNRREFGMIGAMVNLAARLMSASKSGKMPPGNLDSDDDKSIITDTETYLSAKRRIAFATLDPIHVKGKEEEVQIYRARRLLKVEKSPEEKATSLQTKFATVPPPFGRDAQISMMQQSVDTLIRGDADASTRPSLTLLNGEAGTGKTKLLFELRRRIHRYDVHVIVVKVVPGDHQKPLGPFLDLAQKLLPFGHLKTDRERRNALISFVGDTLGLRANTAATILAPVVCPGYEMNDADVNAMTDSYKQIATAHVLAAAFRSLWSQTGAGEKTVLIVDGANNLSEPAWLLLKGLCRAERLRVFIGTRPIHSNRPESVVYLTALQSSLITQLDVQGLDPTNTAKLLVQHAKHTIPEFEGAQGCAEELKLYLHERTQGNPLFLHVWLTRFHARRMLCLNADRALSFVPGTKDYGDQPAVPNEVRYAIISLYDALMPSQQHLLRLCSVLGKRFSIQKIHDIFLAKQRPTMAKEEHLQSIRQDFEALIVRGVIEKASNNQAWEREGAGFVDATVMEYGDDGDNDTDAAPIVHMSSPPKPSARQLMRANSNFLSSTMSLASLGLGSEVVEGEAPDSQQDELQLTEKCCFKWMLFQDVIYNQTPFMERKSLHLQATLRYAGSKRDCDMGKLVHHCNLGGDTRQSKTVMRENSKAISAYMRRQVSGRFGQGPSRDLRWFTIRMKCIPWIRGLHKFQLVNTKVSVVKSNARTAAAAKFKADMLARYRGQMRSLGAAGITGLDDCPLIEDDPSLKEEDGSEDESAANQRAMERAAMERRATMRAELLAEKQQRLGRRLCQYVKQALDRRRFAMRWISGCYLKCCCQMKILRREWHHIRQAKGAICQYTLRALRRTSASATPALGLREPHTSLSITGSLNAEIQHEAALALQRVFRGYRIRVWKRSNRKAPIPTGNIVHQTAALGKKRAPRLHVEDHDKHTWDGGQASPYPTGDAPVYKPRLSNTIRVSATSVDSPQCTTPVTMTPIHRLEFAVGLGGSGSGGASPSFSSVRHLPKHSSSSHLFGHETSDACPQASGVSNLTNDHQTAGPAPTGHGIAATKKRSGRMQSRLGMDMDDAEDPSTPYDFGQPDYAFAEMSTGKINLPSPIHEMGSPVRADRDHSWPDPAGDARVSARGTSPGVLASTAAVDEATPMSVEMIMSNVENSESKTEACHYVVANIQRIIQDADKPGASPSTNRATDAELVLMLAANVVPSKLRPLLAQPQFMGLVKGLLNDAQYQADAVTLLHQCSAHRGLHTVMITAGYQDMISDVREWNDEPTQLIAGVSLTNLFFMDHAVWSDDVEPVLTMLEAGLDGRTYKNAQWVEMVETLVRSVYLICRSGKYHYECTHGQVIDLLSRTLEMEGCEEKSARSLLHLFLGFGPHGTSIGDRGNKTEGADGIESIAEDETAGEATRHATETIDRIRRILADASCEPGGWALAAIEWAETAVPPAEPVPVKRVSRRNSQLPRGESVMSMMSTSSTGSGGSPTAARGPSQLNLLFHMADAALAMRIAESFRKLRWHVNMPLYECESDSIPFNLLAQSNAATGNVLIIDSDDFVASYVCRLATHPVHGPAAKIAVIQTLRRPSWVSDLANTIQCEELGIASTSNQKLTRIVEGIIQLFTNPFVKKKRSDSNVSNAGALKAASPLSAASPSLPESADLLQTNVEDEEEDPMVPLRSLQADALTHVWVTRPPGHVQRYATRFLVSAKDQREFDALMAHGRFKSCYNILSAYVQHVRTKTEIDPLKAAATQLTMFCNICSEQILGLGSNSRCTAKGRALTSELLARSLELTSPHPTQVWEHKALRAWTLDCMGQYSLVNHSYTAAHRWFVRACHAEPKPHCRVVWGIHAAFALSKLTMARESSDLLSRLIAEFEPMTGKLGACCGQFVDGRTANNDSPRNPLQRPSSSSSSVSSSSSPALLLPSSSKRRNRSRQSHEFHARFLSAVVAAAHGNIAVNYLRTGQFEAAALHSKESMHRLVRLPRDTYGAESVTPDFLEALHDVCCEQVLTERMVANPKAHAIRPTKLDATSVLNLMGRETLASRRVPPSRARSGANPSFAEVHEVLLLDAITVSKHTPASEPGPKTATSGAMVGSGLSPPRTAPAVLSPTGSSRGPRPQRDRVGVGVKGYPQSSVSSSRRGASSAIPQSRPSPSSLPRSRSRSRSRSQSPEKATSRLRQRGSPSDSRASTSMGINRSSDNDLLLDNNHRKINSPTKGLCAQSSASTNVKAHWSGMIKSSLLPSLGRRLGPATTGATTAASPTHKESPKRSDTRIKAAHMAAPAPRLHELRKQQSPQHVHSNRNSPASGIGTPGMSPTQDSSFHMQTSPKIPISRQSRFETNTFTSLMQDGDGGDNDDDNDGNYHATTAEAAARSHGMPHGTQGRNKVLPVSPTNAEPPLGSAIVPRSQERRALAMERKDEADKERQRKLWNREVKARMRAAERRLAGK